MSTRARLQNANDSKSLWNYTLSPGWSAFDAHILRLAIMKYGCGAWRSIGRHFPLKNCNQLNLQTQRLFGQQALAEFNKVHVDPNRIKIVNDKIEGFRKNQCLINTGNNLSVEERAKRRDQHIAKYGIPTELYSKIQIPVVLDPPQKAHSVIDDIEKLREMYRCIYDIQLRVRHLKSNKGKNAANIAVNANKNKNKNKNKKKQKTDNSNKSVTNVEDNDVEMSDNNNKNKNKNKSDVVVVEESKAAMPMDDDVAMAMALSMSMANANINTPKPKPKPKKKKKSRNGSKKKKKSSTKKKGRKRKKMDEETCIPQPAKKRIKTK